MSIARRPSGWRAGGPAPSGPVDDVTLWPRPGEDLCYLCGDWRILQRLDGHRWSLDDLVTAWLAADERRASAPRCIADLGCGIGAVLLMLAWRFPAARVFGVEAQAVSVDLARRSLAWNGVQERCTVRLGDLRDPAAFHDTRRCDLVTGTPPYLPLGTATQSSRIQFGPCHFEHRGGIEVYCARAASLLAADGTFVVCAGAAQQMRVYAAAADAALSVVRRVDVIPRAGKDVLFAVFAMQHRTGAPAEHVDAPLVVRDADGRRTAAFRALRCDMGMPP